MKKLLTIIFIIAGLTASAQSISWYKSPANYWFTSNKLLRVDSYILFGPSVTWSRADVLRAKNLYVSSNDTITLTAAMEIWAATLPEYADNAAAYAAIGAGKWYIKETGELSLSIAP